MHNGYVYSYTVDWIQIKVHKYKK